jgi:membrane fusion protein (multidrug efflux system)
MAKRMLLMLIAVGLFFGGVFGWKAFVARQKQAEMAAKGPPVATVSTAAVVAGDWVPTLRSVATLRSAQSVDVTAQVDGQVTKLYFDSGDAVATGTLLVQQYVADDQAQLKALQADLRLAEIELQRIRQLVREELVPQSELDSATSRLDRVRAEVESLEIAIGKKSIRAPFAGRLGIRQIDLGQFIEPGDPIVRLEALDRLYADFKLPQQALPRVNVKQPVRITADAWPGAEFTGEITAIEPAVDAATRNVSLRAEIVNQDGRLRPGMFVEIQVALPERRDVLLVPQTALTFSPFGNSVYVVEGTDEDIVARNVYVNVGQTRGDLVEVMDGLMPGQQIVTSGQLKLRDGARINVDNSVAINANATPLPPES